MTKLDFGEIRTIPITRKWSPNLAFKYRTTAEHKRRIHAFHKFKNHREKIGLPVRFCGDPLAEDEIRFLRLELRKAQNPWDSIAGIGTLIASLNLSLESIQGEIEYGVGTEP